MTNGNITEETPLYTLIPLDEFKAVLGIDDRDDKICRFCLVTAALSIEQYCKRKFLLKHHHERIEMYRDLYVVLREYPVREILALSLIGNSEVTLLEPDFYTLEPDPQATENYPYSLRFSPAVRRLPGHSVVKVVYTAGYLMNEVPTDLASACLELAVWNMNRYKGRRIGMTGTVRGGGRDGEHFETAMPENVRLLLEPYQRRVL